MIFADLARSDRIPTGIGHQVRSLSLDALATVIDRMNKRDRHVHVPFRSSRLTMLLRDSLGGSAKTVLFAHVSCCEREDGKRMTMGTTRETLRFAAKAMMVENTPMRHVSHVRYMTIDDHDQGSTSLPVRGGAVQQRDQLQSEGVEGAQEAVGGDVELQERERGRETVESLSFLLESAAVADRGGSPHPRRRQHRLVSFTSDDVCTPTATPDKGD